MPGEVLKYLLRSTRKYWLFYAVMFVVVSASNVFSVLVPLQMKRLVDTVTATAPSSANFAEAGYLVLTIVILGLVSGFVLRISGYMSARLVPRIRAELEEAGLRGILSHSYSFFADQHMGSLVRRIGRLSDSFDRIYSSFYWQILAAASTAVAIVVTLAFTKPVTAWLVGGWVLFIAFGNWLVTKWKRPTDEEKARRQNAAQGLLADIITNATTVKLFAQEAPESRSYHRRLEPRIRAESMSWYRSEHGLTGTDLAGSFLLGSLLFFALWSLEGGRVTVGDFVLLQSFGAMLLYQLTYIGFAYRDLIEALTNASEIVGILKSNIEVRDTKGAKPLRVKEGRVTFSGITFSYQNKPALSDFNLDILPREKIALVGPSGAGKTTIIKLLLRFYDVTEGKVLVDGQDIGNVTQQSLREQISLVPQDPNLFHRTLKENIAYGQTNVSMKTIIDAAKKAYCHEFISKLPQGYDTMVGERGVKLSGGERQRVAIARAILADAPILILDEATSSLDSESEQLIQSALAELMKRKTVIVIAHRLSTIMKMDRIIVMQDGRIVDDGAHDELRDKVGIYQKLWNIQAGGFQT